MAANVGYGTVLVVEQFVGIVQVVNVKAEQKQEKPPPQTPRAWTCAS